MKKWAFMALSFMLCGFLNADDESTSVPKPGNGVSTFTGGTSLQKGAMSVVLNYHLTHDNGKMFYNQFVPVLRAGLGEKWDFFATLPMQFQVKNGKAGQNYGLLGRGIFYFHKQHFAESIGDSFLSVATNYTIDMPVNNGMTGKWGFGFGVGFSWSYQSNAFVFDVLATPYTDKTARVWAKMGYSYAFTDIVYAGVELDYDYQQWNANTNGSHNLYLGPTISFKVPMLKNSALGFGIFGDAIGKYQNKANMDSWRFSSRLTMIF